jgi:predicted DNA-binding protein (UPF0251 family)
MAQEEVIGLEAMLACVDREIAMRARVYPRWVNQSPPKMTPKTAAQEQARMRAVREALLDAEALRLTVVEYLNEREASMALGSHKAALLKRFPLPK